MALSDQPFTPSIAENALKRRLHTYCSPLDTFAKGVPENPKVEQIWQSLCEYLVRPNSQNQLPPDVSSFAGRLNELQAIAQHLTPTTSTSSAVVPAVFVVSGQAGVGKSALAIRAAHQLRQFYPDAQLYVDLHGSDSHVLSLDRAIINLLRAWNTYDDWLPETLEERLSLYHKTLIDKRALIILDDVGNLAELEPLIPKTAHCAVLITSRHPVEGLATAEQLTLTAMTEDESLGLLSQVTVGDVATASNSEAAKQIVNLCDRTPLAIQIAACTLPDLSSQALADYSSRLANERDLLGSFNSSDLAVRAAFSLAYQELDESCQELFKRFSLSAQPVLTDSMAKMLLASDLDVAKAATVTLLRRRLVRQIDQHRYEFQPLLRLIAREKLAQTELPKRRQAIRTKITRWYLQRAEAMSLLFHPTTRSQLFTQLTEDAKNLLPEGEQTLRLSALQWFDAEHPNLMACITWAYQAKDWDIVTQFAKHLVIFWAHGAHWQDWERSHQISLEGAHNLDDRQLEAQMANNLGNSFLQQAQWEKAKTHYEISLSLFREIGNKESETQTLMNLDILQRLHQAEAITGKLSGNTEETWSRNTSESSTTSLKKDVSTYSAPLQPPLKSGTSKRSLSLKTRETYAVIVIAVTAIVFVTLVLILI